MTQLELGRKTSGNNSANSYFYFPVSLAILRSKWFKVSTCVYSRNCTRTAGISRLEL